MAAPTTEEVRAFLGETGSVSEATISARLRVARQAVFAYTRGAGFKDGEPNEDLAAVILSSAARSVANPGYIASTTNGPFQTSYSRNTGDWTLQELASLNRWRVRATQAGVNG